MNKYLMELYRFMLLDQSTKKNAWSPPGKDMALFIEYFQECLSPKQMAQWAVAKDEQEKEAMSRNRYMNWIMSKLYE